MNGSESQNAYQCEAQGFVRAVEGFGEKFVVGKATLQDYLRFLKSPSPAVRARLAQHPAGEIFKPGVYEETVSLLEETIAAACPNKLTPAASLLAALSKIVGKRLKFTYKAIGQFCGLLFDPKGERRDDPFESDKVRDAIRYLGLVKRQPASVTAVTFNGKEMIITFKGKSVVLTKR